MKKILLTLIVVCFCFIAQAGELEHIFRDAGGWDFSINDMGDCVEDEHLYINLPEEEWNKIRGVDINFRRKTHFSASLCIKCRLINISCCGNDSYR